MIERPYSVKAVVAHTFKTSSTLEAVVGGSLNSKPTSSRTARATRRNTVLKNQTKQKERGERD